MPDQNIPHDASAARHAAEKRSWIIKIYCIIAFFDLGIFGLFPNWWAANSLAVVTALLYLGVRYLANIDAAAQEADGDDAVELREGVGHSMVAGHMAGGDGEACGDDAGELGDAGDDVHDTNDTENDDNDDDDDGKDESEQDSRGAEDKDQKKAENNDINNIDTCHIYGTRTNIYVTQGGSMHIHVAPGGTFNVNVHEDAAVMEAEQEE